MEDSRFNPFPGLRPFDFGEQHLFFGREGQSEQVLRHLCENRFLAVVGTSGSGKSSLIRAGLLPDLYGGFMASAGSHWRFAIFRPMNDPIGNMARALNRPDVLQSEPPAGGDQTRSDLLLEVTLRRSGLGLVEATRLARIPANENLLVVVDQFEELFRFAAAANSASQADDAAAFVKLLLEASRQSEVPIYIVITMRSDFIGDCAKFPDLPEAVTAGMYLIPRMTREQRRRAVEEPVAVGGGAVSLPLVNRLLNEVGDNPDQLPILQHALMRTWEHWVKRTNTESFADDPIDFVDYEAIGGINGALSNHADEAYDALPDARRREIAKRMFQCLTEKGSDNREVRRPTTVGRIAAVAHASVEEVVDVIEEFHKQGRSFLTTPAGVALTGDAVIDISHESLIRLWVRLKEWVNAESESAGTYVRLADDAERHARGRASLLRDPELQNALNWKRDERPSAEWAERYHANFAEAMSFLDRSCEARAAAEAEKERLRAEELLRVKKHLRVVRSLGALVALSAVAAIYFLSLSLEKGKQALQAQAERTSAANKEIEIAVAVATMQKERARAAEAKALAEMEAADLAIAKVQAAMAQREAAAAKASEQAARQEAAVAHAENTELKTMVNQQQVATAQQQEQEKVQKVQGKHQDEFINRFLNDDMTSVNRVVDEANLPSAVQEMIEDTIKHRIDFSSNILDKDPDNRTALTTNTVSRDSFARVCVKQKPREQALKTVEENLTVGESRAHNAKNYYARAVGAALIGVSADMLRLLKEKDKALEAAKSAAEAADSVGLNADSEGKDNVYLNMLSVAYYNAAFVENSYLRKEQAAGAYRKATDARAKSLRISPSDTSVTYFVEDCEALASVEKDLGRFDSALKEYEEAMTEVNGYLSGKTLTAAFSGILVRLHSERGDVFLKKKNYSPAEAEYQKAGTEADGIDRKEAAGQTERIEADRTVGIAWRALASEQAEPAVAEKYHKMALRYSQRGLDQDLDLLKKDLAQQKNDLIAKRYKDLTYAYYNVALDHYNLHEYEDARKFYNARCSNAAAEVFKIDASDDSRRNLADCYQVVDTFETKDDVYNVTNAFAANHRRIETLKPLADRKDGDHEDVTNLAGAIGRQGWFELLLGEFTAALADSEAALKYDTNLKWVVGDQGHALLFLRRTEEARRVYVKYANASTRDSDYLKYIFDDFATFRQRHPPKADLKAVESMEASLLNLTGKDLTPAYAASLVRVRCRRGDALAEKKKDFKGAESEYAKAGAVADEIDRKETAGQNEAIEADRYVGIGWRNISERAESADAKKKFAELALRFHKRSLDLELSQLNNDPSGKLYKDLTYSYFNVARDHYLLHQYDDARKFYNARAEAAVQAVKLAPADEATRYAAECYGTVATFESDDSVGNISGARKEIQKRIDTLEPLAKRPFPASEDLTQLSEAYGTRSWLDILLGDFPDALTSAETALKLDPTQLWIIGNQGHALLFLHRIDEAKQVYLEYAKGGKEDARYQKSVFEDFADLRKHRPPNADLKLVDEMEDFLLTKGGYSKPSEKASN